MASDGSGAVAGCSADQRREDDLLLARSVAMSVLTEPAGTRRSNRAARRLADQLGTDPQRLAACATACHQRGQTGAGLDPTWRRAARLAWNALALVEALSQPAERSSPTPDLRW